MKQVVRGCSLLAVMAILSTSAGAQSKLTPLIGFGMNIATSDYETADSAKTGYQIMAGLERPMFSSITALRIDGSLGWNARHTQFRESTYLAGINARLVVWTPKMSILHPYLLGGVGLTYWKYVAGQKFAPSTSHTETTLGVGAGSDFKVGPATAFLEVRYDYGSDLVRIYPIIVGVRF